MQKAINIRDGYCEGENQVTTKTLNEMLKRGWRVVHMCSITSRNDGLMAFVILEC